MVATAKGLRLHIGVFGRRNVGKSSMLNALVGQNVCIVSDVPGTTTDPVEKVMELKPIGPVVLIDTAGIDDAGFLGDRRVEKTREVMDRTELAVLVTDDWTDYERRLLAAFERQGIPCVIAANKMDLRATAAVERSAKDSGAMLVASTNAVEGEGIDQLRDHIIAATPADFLDSPPIIADLIEPGDTVVFVTPIDIEAPKGRLKMLQVYCMREVLDSDGIAIVTKETELEQVLKNLLKPAAMVVCDSQIFAKVAPLVNEDIPLTTFSILMMRLKGDLYEMVKGAATIESLQPGDKILIAEACTHHPIGEDIGRVQMPQLLEKKIGGKLDIAVVAGRDFPLDLWPYKLIIHCGACVFNRKELLSRIAKAAVANVPITNYGLVITRCLGGFDRAVGPLCRRKTTAP